MRLKIDCMSDFLIASSFEGQRQAVKEPEITLPTKIGIKGRDIILIEDVIDSAKTVSFIKKLLLDGGANSVVVIALVDKPLKRKVEFIADRTYFKAPDKFLVGFGLDSEELYRNLPYVAALKDDIIERK